MIIPRNDNFLYLCPTSKVQFFLRLYIRLVDGVNNPQRKTYFPLPMLLLLIWLPSTEIWKTENNGARKGHAEQKKAFPVSVDAMTRYSFSVDFCGFYSCCCCIIVANSPPLMIICSLLSIFCTSSSWSRCSTNAIWESLDIAALSNGGLDMAISAYHSWEELI